MAETFSQPVSRLLFLCLMAVSATIAAMPEVAFAAEIPKEFRGAWCASSKDVGGQWGAYSSEGSGCDDFAITIGAADLKSADQSLSCVIRDVRQFDVCPWGMIFKTRAQARQKRPGQINPWGPGYHITFECTGSGDRTLAVNWVIEKGNIVSGVPLDYRCPWDRK